MNIERVAAGANIFALLPATYCAYGTWLLLHPPTPTTHPVVQSSPNISGIIASLFIAVALVVLTAILNILAGRKHRMPDQAQTPAAQLVATTTPPAQTATSPVDADAFMRTSYVGQLHPEIEKNVRAMIMSRPESERVEFAVQFIARGTAAVVYDQIWTSIFRSQVLALQELNRNKVLRREEVKKFYDVATQQFPQLYATYTFDQWLEYMKSNALVLEHPGHTIEATVKGRDFLKYLIHWGRSPDDKRH